jgi:hypothetical protein
MKINFSRTGGFMPIPLNAQLDTETMNPAEAGQLQRLIEDSGIMSMQGAEVKGARDMHYYTIKIEDDGQTHRVRFDQISIPSSVKPLIDFLMSRAKTI